MTPHSVRKWKRLSADGQPISWKNSLAPVIKTGSRIFGTVQRRKMGVHDWTDLGGPLFNSGDLTGRQRVRNAIGLVSSCVCCDDLPIVHKSLKKKAYSIHRGSRPLSRFLFSRVCICGGSRCPALAAKCPPWPPLSSIVLGGSSSGIGCSDAL